MGGIKYFSLGLIYLALVSKALFAGPAPFYEDSLAPVDSKAVKSSVTTKGQGQRAKPLGSSDNLNRYLQLFNGIDANSEDLENFYRLSERWLTAYLSAKVTYLRYLVQVFKDSKLSAIKQSAEKTEISQDKDIETLLAIARFHGFYLGSKLESSINNSIAFDTHSFFATGFSNVTGSSLPKFVKLRPYGENLSRIISKPPCGFDNRETQNDFETLNELKQTNESNQKLVSFVMQKDFKDLLCLSVLMLTPLEELPGSFSRALRQLFLKSVQYASHDLSKTPLWRLVVSLYALESEDYSSALSGLWGMAEEKSHIKSIYEGIQEIYAIRQKGSGGVALQSF